MSTGRGSHYYFRLAEGEIRKGSSSSGGETGKWDIQAEGNGVIAPPSIHPTGRVYRFDVGHGLDALKDAPAELWVTAPSNVVDMAAHRDSQTVFADGERNTQLTSRAGSLRRAGFGESEIFAALLETNRTRCSPPLDDAEVKIIAGSVSRYAPASDGKPVKFIASEHAQALAAETPFATGGAQVYVYRDGYYQPGEKLLAQSIVDRLGPDWARRKADEITAYLRIVSPELLESPPLEIVNVANGLLNVKTRELAEHSPTHLSPVRIAAAYDPDAKCPAIDKFLKASIPDLVALFEEIAGYVITPDNRYQKAVMLMGPGGTGKTTALGLLTALVGPVNVSTVALHQLEEDRFATADLYGVLVNIFADLPSHALRSSSILKTITGGDRVEPSASTRTRSHSDHTCACCSAPMRCRRPPIIPTPTSTAGRSCPSSTSSAARSVATRTSSRS